MKQCEICGNDIPWVKDDYASRYQKKRFCSTQCRAKWQSKSKGNHSRTIDATGHLVCTRCQQSKPTEEFPRDAATPTGFGYYCKECRRNVVNASYQRHKLETLSRAKMYRDSKRQEIRSRDKAYYLASRERRPHQYNPSIGRADKAASDALKRGALPPLASQYCVVCMQPAQVYHHQSYHQDDRLCVVPACRSCHIRLNLHRTKGNESFGIVPTRNGLIRIAIATSNK